MPRGFMTLINCSAELLASDRGKGTAVGNSSFCLQLPHPELCAWVGFPVNLLLSSISYIILNVVPNK